METQRELLLRNKDVLFHKLMNGVISDEDFGIYKDRLETELRELEEKIEGQKDGEKSLADQYRRLQQHPGYHRKQKIITSRRFWKFSMAVWRS